MTTFHDLLERFPERHCATAHGVVGYRTAGKEHRGTPIVLLHGIGSGAASWMRQLDTLGAHRHVVAWDAPGYGISTPVEAAEPQADDYAQTLADWLDALSVARCVLVGHSLGAIMASAFAGRWPQRVTGLLLLSPAAGYGRADVHVRADKRDNRLRMLAELGPHGLAEQRSANMLSANAGEEARAWVRWNMARIHPAGYAQATHLLANADLADSAAQYAGPLAIAVGSTDSITPPATCERLAAQLRSADRTVNYHTFDSLGHACYIEEPDVVTAYIEAFVQQVTQKEMQHE